MTRPPTPRVSILLPCRDVESVLDPCIESLQEQTEPRYEVLVLDDGSSDATLSRLGDWAEGDPRVRLIPRAGHGIVDALNALASAARAPFIARMDADDVAYPRRLEAQLEFLERRPGVAACGTRVRYVPRSALRSGYERYERWLNGLSEPGELVRDLFVECPIAHPTLMIRRRILEAVGGYRDREGPEDYDLVLRIVEAGHEIANVPEVLHDWTLDGDRLSHRSPRYSAEAFRRLKIEYLHRGVVPDRPLVIWGVGAVGKAFLRSWLELGGRPPDALIDVDPRKIGQVVHGSAVVDPGVLADRFAGGGSRPFVLVAVGSPGARDEIRAALESMVAAELEDYRVVA